MENLKTWLNRVRLRNQTTAISYKDSKTKQWIHFTPVQYLKKIISLQKQLEQLSDTGNLKNKTVALVSNTRWEWAAFDIAAIAGGALLAPLYANLNDEDVTYILNHSEADIVVLETKKTS